MSHLAVDIIVPVWNRPVETRNCLVSLVNYSPDARIIMVDNGSEREIERILQEFAERLDDHALLLRNDVNQGLVKALNRGLRRGEAEYLVIARSTALVSPGWLEPLLAFARQRPDAGLIVPRIVNPEQKKGVSDRFRSAGQGELGYGSFAAMLIRKELFDAIGGFDEEMDGGFWCLKDYTRRACRSGFLTFCVPDGLVSHVDEAPLGSASRREETLQRASLLFHERWGREPAYCLVMPKGADPAIIGQKLGLLLQGARRGFLFNIVVHAGLFRELTRAGSTSLHENIRFEPLPFIRAAAGLRKILARLTAERPELLLVAGIDGIATAGVENPLTFAELEGIIRRVQ